MRKGGERQGPPPWTSRRGTMPAWSEGPACWAGGGCDKAGSMPVLSLVERAEAEGSLRSLPTPRPSLAGRGSHSLA